MDRCRKTVWALLLATLAIGCGDGGEEATELSAITESLARPVPKIVLIGLDGADWSVARPLMAEGRLPALASLVEGGASGDLRSIEPMISPALWTSVVTGVHPDRHGVRDFVFKQPGEYEQPIVNSSIRERLAVWNILSAVGATVGIVDWYATWPAEEVNGFIISDRIKTIQPDADGVTFPAADSFGELLTDPPPLPQLPALERLRSTGPVLPKGLDKALKEDLFRYRLAKGLYADRRPDFFAFYLKGIDAVGHFYWREFEPNAVEFGEQPPGGAPRFGSIIPDYYELCDQLLADFLGILDADTTVLIVSDHGFRPFGRPDSLIFDLDRLFETMGLLEFEDPALAGQRSERTVRMESTSIYTHEGTKIVSAFGRRDRPAYLNIEGRDPRGVISFEDRERVRADIVARLEALQTDLDTPVFSKIRVNDRADPESSQQEPDLYLRVNPEIAFDYELLVDGKPFTLFETFFWEYGNISGTHRETGVVVARGPNILAGSRIEGASLLDVAPTILHLAGVPVPDDLDGRILSGMLVDRGSATSLHVASYEPMIERILASVDTAPLDEEYREKLRALGYVQ